MYRLMRSVKFTLEHPIRGAMSLFRQRLIGRFADRQTALAACDAANGAQPHRYYVTNGLGQEHYRGTWIG